MTEGRLGKDYCSNPPGCGFLKEIVHIGEQGRKVVKLCQECYDLVGRGFGEIADALIPDRGAAITNFDRDNRPKSPELLKARKVPKDTLTPKERFDRELTRMLLLGLFLGGILGAGTTFAMFRLLYGF